MEEMIGALGRSQINERGLNLFRPSRDAIYDPGDITSPADVASCGGGGGLAGDLSL